MQLKLGHGGGSELEAGISGLGTCLELPHRPRVAGR